jgi:cellulose biosynthesis protein BcsQ
MAKKPNLNRNIIGFLNRKGGVGKSTISKNVASALQSLKQESLLIDWDEQRNLTSGFDGASDLPYTITDFLDRKKDDQIKVYEVNDKIMLLTGSSKVGDSDFDLMDQNRFNHQIKKHIEDNTNVLIDLNPSIKSAIKMCKVACDTFIIPLSSNCHDAYKQAVLTAEEIDDWNLDYEDNPIRYAFVHNKYKDTKDINTIIAAIKTQFPKAKVFQINERAVVKHANNKHLLLRDYKSSKGDGKEEIEKQYKEIAKWIRKG